MTVVGLILLIACANVSSLLLARAVNRQHELAIRQAIGAGRARIVRQLLSEAFLLAVMGTIAGLAMFVLLGAVANRISLPVPAPVHLRMQPDWRLLGYAFGLAILSTFVCGLVPALRATKRDLQPALKLELRTVASRLGFQRGLVIAQLTVSVILVLAGFLFVRNLMLSNSLDPGFDIHHTVWASIRLVPERYSSKDPAETSKRIGSVSRLIIEQLRSMPGIESASTLAVVPLNHNAKFGGEVTVDGKKQLPLLYAGNWIGTDYFKTMEIRLIAGRDFRASDSGTAATVVILNQSMALHLFGNVNPIGHTLRLLDDPPVTVVGVVGDSKYFSLGEDHMPAVYWPDAQVGRTETTLNFVLRATNPESLLKPVNHLLLQIDPSAAVEVKPIAKALGFALLPSEIGAILLGSMGALGLVLASVGLYGVLAYSVSRRIKEIGIRLALGSRPATVAYLVIRSSLTLVGIGLTLGACLGYFAVTPLSMFLVPGLSPHDPLSIAAVFTTLLLVGLFATGTPAMRAIRVNPTVALHYE
jgi:predicted permease